MTSFANQIVDKDAKDMMESNEDQKISDVFNYFKNSLNILCDYETLLDYTKSQPADVSAEELKQRSELKPKTINR